MQEGRDGQVTAYIGQDLHHTADISSHSTVPMWAAADTSWAARRKELWLFILGGFQSMSKTEVQEVR